MTALPQHLEALSQANKVRRWRTDRKAEFKAMNRKESLLAMADFIESNPPRVATIQIGDLLCWVARVQVSVSNKLRATCNYRTLQEKQPTHLRSEQRLGSLTDRQRAELAKTLRMAADE
jgi:hypothetical protein